MKAPRISYLASIHEPGKILYAVGIRDEIEGSAVNRIDYMLSDGSHLKVYFDNGNAAYVPERYVIIGWSNKEVDK